MPKGTKKSKSDRGRQMVAASDFTVHDFANAATPKSGRMKKGESLTAEVKALSNSAVIRGKENLEWFEKDLSDFDTDHSSDSEDGEAEKDAAEACVRPKTKTPKKKLKTRDEDTGMMYPQDLWFLIGSFVYPEDVCRFGAICKGSHLVVHTAQFWSNLYRRHYNPAVTVPLTLQPPSMDKIHGLQPNVVRSLFYTYPPFQDRVKHLVPFEIDPQCLEGARCIMMWHQQVKTQWRTQWHFFFKFYRELKSQCPLARIPPSKSDPLLGPLNIHYNPEQNCCVVKVTTNNFIYLPTVMGHCLIQSSISVGHAMRYHKLKMVFNSQNVSYNKSSSDSGTTLIIDPVLNIHVLQWWDPKYPYSAGTNLLQWNTPDSA